MIRKPLLLAIDTATHFAGLALYDGDIVRAEQYWLSQNNHSVELMPALVDMLAQQGFAPRDLSAVGVTIGPGSFTGLRIGLSVAKGLAMANKLIILGVPTLDVQALVAVQRMRELPKPCDDEGHPIENQPELPGIDRMLSYYPAEQRRPIISIIQAGRNRLCTARYEYRRGQWQRRGRMQLTTLYDLVDLIGERCLVCGELSQEEIDILAARVDPTVVFASSSQAMRRPSCLAELAWLRFQRGEADDLASLSPIYLKSL
ncbi:MAG: tRNA (adenosine(37)-N6)-threonylcarbamoyltransferase complex dimerization subunit type 1 TsaB [Anaerolineae bacterium]|nr:tRNA (adenosine(37)-N6)-threonylcarbamoyltransferase complex dimerization subunit type 1 TsaB [Anaerolineae bacterium]